MDKSGPDALLRIADVADYCDVSEKTVRRWIKAGELRAARLGDQWRVLPNDLDLFIRSRLSQ